MYKHCTTEESFLRQRQIEEKLLELMQTLPYSQITITHICEYAGISRKSFYRYFGSRDGCLCALIDHRILDGASQYLPEHNEPPRSHRLYERFFSYWQQQAPLLRALTENGLCVLMVERMMFHVDQEERDFHYYLDSSSYDNYEQLVFMVCGLAGLLVQWYSTGFQKSPGQMADIMMKITSK